MSLNDKIQVKVELESGQISKQDFNFDNLVLRLAYGEVFRQLLEHGWMDDKCNRLRKFQMSDETVININTLKYYYVLDAELV